MVNLKNALIFVAFVQVVARTTIDLNLFQPTNRLKNNNSLTVTAASPSIPQRIHASLNNVLRIPLPIWGTSNTGVGLFTSAPPPSALQNTEGGPESEQVQNYRLSGTSQHGATPFLPGGIQAIHSTISQLSTLTHWPFGYVTTAKYFPSAENVQFEKTTAVPQTITTVPPTTITLTSTGPMITTKHSVTQPPTTLPIFLPSSAIFSQLHARPSSSPSNFLPSRIHNRLQSTLGNYIRLPNLGQIGQPQVRPMLTEPTWVTELLGPTLEPPTTRTPSLGERVHNTINNALLFVPATLLNFWYQNWGTLHVDRIIQRLQVSTPKPGINDPVFATISQNNPFANFTKTGAADLPAIAAFINANGTLMPTIVHPVVNISKKTIEYQLRSENNETTILWTGSLSNDIFLGNRTTGELVEEDNEDELIKNSALNVKLK
ncbi:unnamed protein product [Orchesella dallaii]|uniref:Uncharacterized protein n=1 Tax=Orchesella dallaii TaxID=48710 RepID=A0ABP1PZD6_9HEXA